MKVKVLFFGATADEAGTSETQLDIPAESTSASAFDSVIEAFPALTASRRREDLLFAVNQEYISGDESVSEGDELAIFTAVSGG
jgi:molybdopterin converting factor subunit 1